MLHLTRVECSTENGTESRNVKFSDEGYCVGNGGNNYDTLYQLKKPLHWATKYYTTLP